MLDNDSNELNNQIDKNVKNLEEFQHHFDTIQTNFKEI